MRFTIILTALVFALVGYGIMTIMKQKEPKAPAVEIQQLVEQTSQASPTTTQAPVKEKDAIKEIFKFTELEKIKTTSKLPIVLKCSAEWCGPCRVMKPVFKKAADELKDKAQFYAINTDQFEGVDKLNIMGIPTFIIYKDNKEVGRFAGARNYDDFKKEIQKQI